VADPGRPWLYVVGWADAATAVPFIDVYDRGSLARVARLRVPAWAAPSVPSITHPRRLDPPGEPVERRLFAT